MLIKTLIILSISYSVFGKDTCRDGSSNCMLENSLNKNQNIKTNIDNQILKICSEKPLTGYFRDGTCSSDISDYGNHSVCAVMTEEFLTYTLKLGNNLISPNPKYGFPGLRPGDKWCLCATRWQEAYDNNIKVAVDVEATHIRALEVISKSKLKGAQ